MGAPVLGIHVSDGPDRLDPAGWVGWYVDRFLVVLLDTPDGFAQRAMQRRVVGEVLPDGLVDAIELTLDDAFFRFAPGREQNVAVTNGEIGFRPRHGFGRHAKTTVQALRRGLNSLVYSIADQIERGVDQDDPK